VRLLAKIVPCDIHGKKTRRNKYTTTVAISTNKNSFNKTYITYNNGFTFKMRLQTSRWIRIGHNTGSSTFYTSLHLGNHHP
jgi:hypothetical protein